VSCAPFHFPSNAGLILKLSTTKVTGASDKTLRQWDLTTGQCVMTMDILWAISHPSSTTAPSPLQNQTFPGSFSVQMPPYADGTGEFYEDFVGGVQFWGYGLVSGSGDGAVRMWDSEYTRFWIHIQAPEVDLSPVRTGQAHRTLLGHTGPVACLQFDEIHIASGSLDKTLKVSNDSYLRWMDAYSVIGLGSSNRRYI